MVRLGALVNCTTVTDSCQDLADKLGTTVSADDDVRPHLDDVIVRLAERIAESAYFEHYGCLSQNRASSPYDSVAPPEAMSAWKLTTNRTPVPSGSFRIALLSIVVSAPAEERT